jgi:hypothetical protein
MWKVFGNKDITKTYFKHVLHVTDTPGFRSTFSRTSNESAGSKAL